MATKLKEVLTSAQKLGYIGKKARIEEEIQHSLVFGEVLFNENPEKHHFNTKTILDLGSGGGLPALVLAFTEVNTRWILVDRSKSRSEFLTRAASNLDIQDRVSIINQPLEEMGHNSEHRENYPLITSRALGPPYMSAEIISGLLKIEGKAIVSRPPDSLEEEWPSKGLEKLGLEVSFKQKPRNFAVITKRFPCPHQYPRRLPAMRRSPLL